MCPALVNQRGRILLHDNARSHVSHLVIQKLNQLRYEFLLYHAYSPDLTPTDSHLFKHVDGSLKEKNFSIEAGIEIACVSLLPVIQISSGKKLVLLHIVGRGALIVTVSTDVNKLYFLLRCHTVKLPSKIGKNLCDDV